MGHANRILSQAGQSLADVYDIEGSVAGLEELDSAEVKTVHEMGATIASERMSGQLVVVTSTALAQTLTWDATLGLPRRFIDRILGIQVLADADRVLTAGVFVQDAGPGGSFAEIPIWSWDAAVDGVKTIRTSLQESTRNLILLQPTQMLGPSMLIGSEQPLPTGQLVFRGVTTTFGAGTVTVRMVAYLAFNEIIGGGGLSSKGLPLPSW